MRAGRFVPAGLIALTAVPILGGVIRVAELAAGAEVGPANARFFAAPVPVVVHVVGAGVYCVLGAFQFAPTRRSWHRAAGRLLVPCGIAAALSGLWMAAFYPHPVGDGALLTAFRLLFGAAMAVSIALGAVAIHRRDGRTHRAWMIRGYAIGVGAGTQFLVYVGWSQAVGPPDELTRALLMAAGWVINLAVAEVVIRRRGASMSSAVAGGPSADDRRQE